MTEVSWAQSTVRIAVADGGAPTEPAIRPAGPQDLQESGHGLQVVARLSTRYGTDGDHRGRVVWAEFSSYPAAPSGGPFPLCPEPAVTEDTAMLAARYAGWHTWFGRWTRQWWAVPRGRTRPALAVLEPTVEALAQRLDAIEGDARQFAQ